MARARWDKPFDFRQVERSMSRECSDFRNNESSPSVPISGADKEPPRSDNPIMSDDWFLQEWMARREKRQADLVRELGWTRRKASELYNGDQPYKRDIVNEVARWLQIEQFELLMSPDEADQLRQVRQAALAIAANEGIQKAK